MADKATVETKHYQEERKATPRKRHMPKWVIVVVSSLLGLAVLLVGLYGFYSYMYRDRIFPNVMIGSVNVGGMARLEAIQAVNTHVNAFIGQQLPIQIASDSVVFRAATVDASFNTEAGVDQAYAVARSGSFVRDALSQVSLLLFPTQSESIVSYEPVALKTFLDTLSTKFDVPEQNAGFSFENSEFTTVPPKNGQRFQRQVLRDRLEQYLRAMQYPDNLVLVLEPTSATVQVDQVVALRPTIERVLQQPITLEYKAFSQQVTPEQIAAWLKVVSAGNGIGTSTGNLARLDIDTAAIKAYVATISQNIVQEPVDAKLTIVDGKATVFQASKDGLMLDQDTSVNAITLVLTNRLAASGQVKSDTAPATVTLAVTVKKPTVSSETITDLGIKELIGHGETDFSGSPNNRVHNITTGTKYLNGWLVKPGETFSTVKALGAVDASTGYLPELVIKENKTIPEYGGGLCQVSTTLFRAVLNAGLKVTERRNHSYRVTYYERGIGPGLDASVYLPKPDLQFLNDTPGWILVQGEVKGNQLIFDVYGTKDGRSSEIQGPFTTSTTAPPADVYETVSSMAPGEVKQTEKAHEGARTTATYIVTKDGKELFRQTFDSVYKALPARFLKGPDAAEPAAEPQDSTPTDTAPSV